MALDPDAFEKVAADKVLAAEQAKTADARRERDAAKHALQRMAAEVHELESKLQIVEGIAALSPTPPKWLTPKKPKTAHATAYAPLSDLHLDEIVDADEMNGVNCYNRDIAMLRLKRWAEKLIIMSRDHLAGLTWDGVVIPLNGDIFSGDIHEELSDTNEAPLLASFLFWLEHVAAAIGMAADEFGNVFCPVTPGNHGRRSRKSRMKGRSTDNLDWLFGHMLAKMFAGDDRVTFQIPESFDIQHDIYGTTIRQEHGDAFKGGSGIAGIWSPIARGHAKRSSTANSTDRPFDILSIGHFHTLIFGPAWIINGSLKGYDEYAAISGFGFEAPSQAFAVVTPEHGVTWRAPVFVADRKAEGW